MRTAIVTIEGISPYSQSRYHDAPKLNDKEKPEDYDRRTWREHAHYDPKTREVYIPPMSIKMAIAEAAKRLSIKKKGQQTYTKNILSGILVPLPARLGVMIDDLGEERFFANLDGVRGSGKRGMRGYPIIPAGWKAQVQVMVIDEAIPEEIVERCLEEAGNLIGIGRFRPERGGYLGRFKVNSIKWQSAKVQKAA
jgi:hypothetical protein